MKCAPTLNRTYKPRRKKPIDSPLKKMWVRVEVKSCADGSLRVDPDWIGPKYDPEDGGGPGVGERLSAAAWLELLINKHMLGVK